MPIKTVLFDLGNVLVDFSHERMCSQLANVFNVETELIRSHLFESGLSHKFERGELSEEEFQEDLEGKLNCQCTLTALQQAAGDIFTKRPEMEEFVTLLKNQGFRLVLLSNTCVTHINWIQQHFTILQHFDDLVLSYEVGRCKPEEGIYRVALEKIHCLPEECLYTDDIPENIASGQRFGLQAILFQSPTQFIHDLSTLDFNLPHTP